LTDATLTAITFGSGRMFYRRFHMYFSVHCSDKEIKKTIWQSIACL